MKAVAVSFAAPSLRFIAHEPLHLA